MHTSHTKHNVLDLFNVCSNHAPFNYSGQESKNNLQFMILTYLWPWNKVKVIKTWYKLLDREQSYNQSKFEDFPKTVSTKKPTLKFSLNQKTHQISPLNMCKSEKQWCIHYLLGLLNKPTKFQLDMNTKFSVKTVQLCCILEIWSRSPKVVWTCKAQWIVPSGKVWHLLHLWYLRKSKC